MLVNFCLGDHQIHQGKIDSEKDVYLIMNETTKFVQIYNKHGDPITYNKNNIVWICKVREEV